jgi:hypothetical protein
MREYTYDDFFDTLGKSGQVVLPAINEHITSHYSKYKPFDIKPMNKSENEWRIHYRKKPKVGKALCSVYSTEGKLSVQVCLLSSMTHAFLIRQHEFSDKARNNILRQAICAVNKSCRNYGGNNICPWPAFYWINNRLIRTCHYPWIRFDNCEEDDIADIKLFLDIQANHMVQNPKDIKGSGYTEGNLQRCGEVRLIALNDINLDIDAFEIGDHVKKAERLDKYTRLYNLVPMGEKDGLWFYLSDEAIRGLNRENNAYSHNEMPKGRYAMVVIENPFTFSLNRAWNYICQWTQDNKETVNGVTLNNNENTACLARFFIEDSKECMAVYIPVK